LNDLIKRIDETDLQGRRTLSVNDIEQCGSCVAASTKKEDQTGPLNTPLSHSHLSPALSPYIYLATRRHIL